MVSARDVNEQDAQDSEAQHLAADTAEDDEKKSSVYVIRKRTVDRARNLLAFWVLGFCNNFTYWVLITAAFDILSRTNDQSWRTGSSGATFPSPYSENTTAVLVNNDTTVEQCSTTSTGTLLIAETLPATAITLSALMMLRMPVHLRVFLVVVLCLVGYLTLAFSAVVWIDFAGVVFVSISRGLSDITFLAHAANYERDVLSTWSSGTGVATFVGPLLYAGLTTSGLAPRHTLLSMSAVPLFISISFWCLLTRPHDRVSHELQQKYTEVTLPAPGQVACSTQLVAKITRVMRASRYIMPLFVFYVEMYFMNSGLLELIYFPGIWLSHSQQYRWYSTTRCLGQMLSRSGHRWFHTTYMWLPVIGHALILAVMLLEACLHFLPSVWIMFGLLLIEGLLEGTQFKSTMFNIYTNVEEDERAECLAIMPMAFFPPAVISGFLAIPLHEALCKIV